MSFFGRLGNLWRGFLSLWIADLETRNPEIVYENSIETATKKYTGLKSITASIIRRRDEIQARLSAANKAMLQTQADLSAALDSNQDDIAELLIEKQQKLESEIKDLEGDAEQAGKEADDAKASLLQVKAMVNNLKAEKDQYIAKLRSAEARIKINEQLEGLSVDAEVQSLGNVREHIKNKVSEANLSNELQDNDLDKRLAKLRSSASGSSAKAELARIKAARQKEKEKTVPAEQESK